AWAAGSLQGLSTVGSGLRTTAGQTAVILPGMPTSSGPSPYAYFFVDLNGAVSGVDTVYVADDRAIASGGGVQRWNYNGTTWSLVYTLTAGLTAGTRGLTGVVDLSGNPVLFATTADSTSKLVTVTDMGSSSAFSTLATAGVNTAFRGVVFAPQNGTTPTPTPTPTPAGTPTPIPTPTPTPTIVPIHDIQGSGSTSPLNGQTLTTTGIVTALRSNGFFLESPDANADVDTNTSEGIFVFTSSAPAAPIVVGNSVQVTATVQEFVPSADPFSPSTTELITPSVSLLSTGNALPSPHTITASETLVNDLNNLEKYEGMRVHVDTLVAESGSQGNVNETNATSSSTGIFYGVIPGVARPFREAGIRVLDPVPTPYPSGVVPANVPRFDFNP